MEMKRPMIGYTLSLIAGIGMGKIFGTEYVFLILCGVFFCGLFYWGKKSLRIAGLCFLVGLSLPFLRDPLWDDGFNGRYVKVEGRVERVFQKGENQKLLLQGEKMNGAAVREKFYIRGVTTEYVPGEKISVEGFFRSPRAQKNPYLFDEQNYIRSLGAAGSIQAENISSLECVHWKLKGHLYVLSRLREFSRTTENLLQRSMLGYGEGDFDALREIGLAHILAASGFHLGLLSFFFLHFLLLSGLGKRQASIWTVLVLWLYGAFIGFPPGLLRSLVMFTLLIFSVPFRKRYDALDALCIAAWISLFINPWWLFQPAFLLSYGGTACLLILYPALQAWGVHKILALPLSVALGLLPWQLHFFVQWNPWTILANILLLPFFMVAFIGAFLYLIFGFTPLLGSILKFFVEQSSGIFLILSEDAAELPGRISTAAWNLPLIIVYFILLYLLFSPATRQWQVKKSWRKFLVTGTLFLCAAPCFQILYPPFVLRHIAIGQGDAALIQGSYNLMVDTGGEKYGYDSGEGILFPLLRKLGISTIHGLYITHLDADHCENALELVKQFHVKGVFLPPPKEYTPWFQNFLLLCQKKQVPVYELTSGEIHNWGNLQIQNEFADLSGNDGSLMQRIQMDKISILFTGDAGFETEKQLMDRFAPVKVLKVGHHGSKYSTGEDFLRKISPKYGILSCGENNRYGHPHQEVMEKLQERKIKIYRTDTQGCITVKSCFGLRVSTHEEETKELFIPWLLGAVFVIVGLWMGKRVKDEDWI